VSKKVNTASFKIAHLQFPTLVTQQSPKGI